MKIKALFQIAAILYGVFTHAQDRQPVSKGTITITTGQKIKFKDLKYVEDQVVFTNLETKTEFIYFVNSVKLITDEPGNVIYAKEGETKKTGTEEPKGPVYSESGTNSTVRADIVLKTGDTLHTNVKVSTNFFDPDLINELSINEKITIVEMA